MYNQCKCIDNSYGRGSPTSFVSVLLLCLKCDGFDASGNIGNIHTQSVPVSAPLSQGIFIFTWLLDTLPNGLFARDSICWIFQSIKPFKFTFKSWCCNKMSTLIPVSGQHTGLYTGPYFAGLSLSRVLNLTAVLGHTVHLPCHVKQLGTNALAWVRNRDSSILSIDTDIITHDSRFRIVDSEDKQDWVLIIRWVTEASANRSELYKMSNYSVIQLWF